MDSYFSLSAKPSESSELAAAAEGDDDDDDDDDDDEPGPILLLASLAVSAPFPLAADSSAAPSVP